RVAAGPELGDQEIFVAACGGRHRPSEVAGAGKPRTQEDFALRAHRNDRAWKDLQRVELQLPVPQVAERGVELREVEAAEHDTAAEIHAAAGEQDAVAGRV